jgi:hypothetical protein
MGVRNPPRCWHAGLEASVARSGDAARMSACATVHSIVGYRFDNACERDQQTRSSEADSETPRRGAGGGQLVSHRRERGLEFVCGCARDLSFRRHDRRSSGLQSWEQPVSLDFDRLLRDARNLSQGALSNMEGCSLRRFPSASKTTRNSSVLRMLWKRSAAPSSAVKRVMKSERFIPCFLRLSRSMTSAANRCRRETRFKHFSSSWSNERYGQWI